MEKHSAFNDEGARFIGFCSCAVKLIHLGSVQSVTDDEVSFNITSSTKPAFKSSLKQYNNLYSKWAVIYVLYFPIPSTCHLHKCNKHILQYNLHIFNVLGSK
jgi:hypothetical protein